MKNDEITESLNELLTVNYDAEKGYQFAAERVENGVLAQKLREKARVRYELGHQIKALIGDRGGEVKKGDSLSSKLHRGWMAVRESLTSSETGTVLDECVRGEESALTTYVGALTDHRFPNDVATVLTRHRGVIQADLTELSSMSQSYAS